MRVNDSVTGRMAAISVSWVVGLPRSAKRAVARLADAFFVVLCLGLALLIRIPEQAGGWVTSDNLLLLPCFVVGSLLIWSYLGLYRAILRYLDIRALSTIFLGSLASSVLLAIWSFLSQAGLPRSVPIIYFGLVLICVAGSRLVVRGLLESSSRSGSQKIIIYGAGAAGRQLCVALQNGSEFEPIAFVDDDARVHGARVLGVRVLSPATIGSLIESEHASKILFAIPSASKSQKAAIFNAVENLGVDMLTIPSSADLVNGTVTINTLRSLDIDDLLGRDVVIPSTALLNGLSGKTVLITGAGGSIGSELCRQVNQLDCNQLILLEHSELQLYNIERELLQDSGVTIVPILGSVLDERLVEQLFDKYKIDVVYHAAAYKHVPLVELNTAAGFFTNTCGTQLVAEVALRKKAERFVLISTDKAVRPTNIMGASKRLAELYVQLLAQESESTVFSMVRFGNVLGSSGSVVPLFKSQIEEGGPVTVTHPNITRYFMTIPEAAALVLQAGAMAEGGEVFVLDMGQPVKILDLAQKVIRLMGLSVKDDQHPDGDIAIEFSGLRPGEKLYEELLLGDDVQGTAHPRIMCANEQSLSRAELVPLLDRLELALKRADFNQAREILQSAPLGYEPLSPVVDLLASVDHGTLAVADSDNSNVTFLCAGPDVV